MLIMKNDELSNCNVKPFERLNEFERVTLPVLLSGEAASLCSIVSHINKNLFYLSMHHYKHLDERLQRQVYDIYGEMSLLFQRLNAINFDLTRGDGVE